MDRGDQITVTGAQFKYSYMGPNLSTVTGAQFKYSHRVQFKYSHRAQFKYIHRDPI